jgi:hypothetical protein
MNYLKHARSRCLRQNLHTFACFCIIKVELLAENAMKNQGWVGEGWLL